MSLMKTVIRQPTPKTAKLIIYGEAGVGKTTIAANANAFLIDCEGGAENIVGLVRTPYLQSWSAIKAWLDELLITDLSGVSAIAIDTLDWMVHRIVEYVVCDLDGKNSGADNLDAITNTLGCSHGGFFKAREIVQNIVFRQLLPALNKISAKGITIILLAHASNQILKNPDGSDERIAAPSIPGWLSPVFIEWADAVLYAHKDNDGNRNFTTSKTSKFFAKNRYSMPEIMPMNWRVIEDAINATKQLKGNENGLS